MCVPQLWYDLITNSFCICFFIISRSRSVLLESCFLDQHSVIYNCINILQNSDCLYSSPCSCSVLVFKNKGGTTVNRTRYIYSVILFNLLIFAKQVILCSVYQFISTCMQNILELMSNLTSFENFFLIHFLNISSACNEGYLTIQFSHGQLISLNCLNLIDNFPSHSPTFSFILSSTVP